ncbi:hypothetical protein CLOSTMETH_00579 [[Clostridium] methylpentosum DSM 5476]|uniref:Uncharacterized protein n=1 Tax=[Clostridium] methylpentosum DSM 5476 TaxID=537013 RepID=C0E9S8_9FIRM|nr:hypothetical protein CLOSTMETH_00579 [[Clostridium] methylpentosum DSM 5476]
MGNIRFSTFSTEFSTNVVKNIKLKKIIDSAECRENTAFPWKTRRKKTGETGFFQQLFNKWLRKNNSCVRDW